jgi:hypothetical protein
LAAKEMNEVKKANKTQRQLVSGSIHSKEQEGKKTDPHPMPP